MAATRCSGVNPGQFDNVGEDERPELIVGLLEGSSVGAAVIGSVVGALVGVTVERPVGPSDGGMVGDLVAPSSVGSLEMEGSNEGPVDRVGETEETKGTLGCADGNADSDGAKEGTVDTVGENEGQKA
jgi:hypothetical protein